MIYCKLVCAFFRIQSITYFIIFDLGRDYNGKMNRVRGYRKSGLRNEEGGGFSANLKSRDEEPQVTGDQKTSISRIVISSAARNLPCRPTNDAYVNAKTRSNKASFPCQCLCDTDRSARETLIKSQSQILQEFLYIASSYPSLNSSLFSSGYSLLCIKIQE